MKLSKASFFMIVQWSVVIIAFLIIRQLDADWPLYVLVVIALAVMLYRLLNLNNDELIMDVQCNPNKYLHSIEKRKEKNGETLYHLQKAYAYLHLDELEKMKSEFSKIDYTLIKNQNRYYYIYIMIRARVYSLDKDLDALIELVKELSVKKDLPEGLLEYVKVYRLLVENRKDDALTQLKNAIPTQKNRLQIFEFEYLLAKLYYEQEAYVDSAFVADFVSEKKFESIYIERCRELAFEAKKQIDNQENK